MYLNQWLREGCTSISLSEGTAATYFSRQIGIDPVT